MIGILCVLMMVEEVTPYQVPCLHPYLYPYFYDGGVAYENGKRLSFDLLVQICARRLQLEHRVQEHHQADVCPTVKLILDSRYLNSHAISQFSSLPPGPGTGMEPHPRKASASEVASL